MGKILKDITRYSPQDKVNFFIKNLPKECQENFDITFDFLKKLGFSELLDKVDNFDISQSFYTYRDDLVDKTKSNFEKIDAFVDTLPVGNRLQAMIDQTNSCMYLFYEYTGDNVDFIAGLDTSNVTDMSEMFYKCQNLTTIPQLDTGRVTNMSEMFYTCRHLTTIPQLDVSKVTNMSYMFDYCDNLTKISMLNIGTNLDIHYCTKMTREALLEVLGNLKDLTGATSKKLTLGSTLLAKLTEDDIALATNKNWTLA